MPKPTTHAYPRPSEATLEALETLFGERPELDEIQVSGGRAVWRGRLKHVPNVWVKEMTAALGEPPVCEFADEAPPDEDDLFWIVAVFPEDLGGAGVGGLKIQMEFGAGRYANHAQIEVAVPLEHERGTDAALKRMSREVQAAMLAKAWRGFRDTCLACHDIGLEAVFEADERTEGDNRAIRFVAAYLEANRSQPREEAL